MTSMRFNARLNTLVNEKFFVSSVVFTDEARFGRDGIIYIHNQHQWAEENPHAAIHSRHQQQFSINVWAGIVGDCLVGPHVVPHRHTGNRYQYMICQSCWKMYNWQPEHECGTCMMVLLHIVAALCEMFSIS
jgi:hypothetical protein